MFRKNLDFGDFMLPLFKYNCVDNYVTFTWHVSTGPRMEIYFSLFLLLSGAWQTVSIKYDIWAKLKSQKKATRLRAELEASRAEV